MSSPTNTAQKGCGPFAVLRRAKNVKNASEVERNALRDDAERIETWSVNLVLGAIVLEAIVWISPLCPFLFKLGNFLADAAVALGIYGEVRFGHVAGTVLKIQLAEATERASKADEKAAAANLEVARLQVQMAPRVLTEEQIASLSSLKGQEGIAANVTWALDLEASTFAWQIVNALMAAGVTVKIFDPRLGNLWTGNWLIFPDSVPDHLDTPLAKAFIKAELYNGGGKRSVWTLSDMPPDIPIIMVGLKYLPAPKPKTAEPAQANAAT